MNYAIPYRDHSRAPLAFGLSALLHGLLVGALLAFFFAQTSTPPVNAHTFELVSGPSAADSPGPVSTPGPLITVPAMRSVPTPPAPTPVEATPAPQPDPAPPPPKPTPVTSTPPRPTPPISPRGATPAPKQPNVMSAAEWQKRQGITAATTPNRSASRPVPKVGVSTDGIMDNLNKLASGSGSTTRTGPAGNAGNKSNLGNNGESDDYFARVIQQIRAVFVAPPAVDGLSATFRLVIGADGTVISAHLLQRSPDDRFNAAVNAALARLKNVGPPPGGEQLTKDFRFVPSTP